MDSICITQDDCDCKQDYGGFACIGMFTQKCNMILKRYYCFDYISYIT